MDSDDEMMSDGISSQEEEEEYGGTQDTDSGSVDDGTQQKGICDAFILSVP